MIDSDAEFQRIGKQLRPDLRVEPGPLRAESSGWSTRESLLLADGFLCEARRSLAVVSGCAPTDVPAALTAMASSARHALSCSGLHARSAETLRALFDAAAAIASARKGDAAACLLQAYLLLREDLAESDTPPEQLDSPHGNGTHVTIAPQPGCPRVNPSATPVGVGPRPRAPRLNSTT